MGRSKSKYTKYKIMKKNRFLANYLPETCLYTRERLLLMLGRHKQVIIKPNVGKLGKGVIKISDLGRNYFFGKKQYEVHIGNTSKTFDNFQSMLFYVERIKDRKKNVIQRYIPLATIDDQLFDMRIMLQRKKRSKNWVVSGKAVKVTFEDYIISNACIQVKTLEEAIGESSLEGRVSVERLNQKIDYLSIILARHLQKYYKKDKEIGLDLAIDKYGRLWIIEANFKPMINMFMGMEDESVYNNILAFRKSM
ncbi:MULTISPECIES: YheC/YheD family protein [Alteribacter]|uniref:YheC/D like ATP-grasp n=1 Tax=Alteribacter keqinensis TaxID=2483800 RepID=A0A3M7TNG8_9BACI|nr:YheC/YheD family protein [Alteribacter keqinensis]MBM7094990.1 YheC/YheD family protein [Alteribacter salitolerans]RNA66784.1 hypothetical protein EBO34_16375 [Alteribacter keqinensis]